jgi:hypothetical protein
MVLVDAVKPYHASEVAILACLLGHEIVACNLEQSESGKRNGFHKTHRVVLA